MSSVIWPSWPAPKNIRIALSSRTGGNSHPPYWGNNLALHVGDDNDTVGRNRKQFAETACVNEWLWLDQVHSTKVISSKAWRFDATADGSFTRQKKQGCVVLTADCLPILLCDQRGTQVSAIHAGWRGLADGIVEAALAQFPEPGQHLIAYLGACIQQPYFEVGEDVKLTFFQRYSKLLVSREQSLFLPGQSPGKYQADLLGIARCILLDAGVDQIYGGEYCTNKDNDLFYSYRKEGITGRHASAIWID